MTYKRRIKMKLKIFIIVTLSILICIGAIWSYRYGYKIGSYIGTDLSQTVEKSNANHF